MFVHCCMIIELMYLSEKKNDVRMENVWTKQ